MLAHERKFGSASSNGEGAEDTLGSRAYGSTLEPVSEGRGGGGGK